MNLSHNQPAENAGPSITALKFYDWELAYEGL